MKKKMRNFLIFLFVICITLLLGCAEVPSESEITTDEELIESEDIGYIPKPTDGEIYISSLYDYTATDLEMESVNLQTERYQNPNALEHRTLEWGEYSWNLTYSFSDTMNYVDFDVDFYRVDGTEKYAYVTFEKDTDQLVRAYNLPLSQGFFAAFTEDSYHEKTESIIDTFCDMPLENLIREEYTTYTIYGENYAEGGRTKEGFYVTQEGERATFRLTSYYEKLDGEYTTLKHVVVEFNSYDSVVIEVYDIDTEDVAAFLRERDVSTERDFSNHVENHVNAKGYDFVSAVASSEVWYKKGGEYCSHFMGSMEYKNSEGKTKSVMADFIMKYQR